VSVVAVTVSIMWPIHLTVATIRNPLTGVDGNSDLMKDILHTINNWIRDNQTIDPADLPVIM